MFTKPGYQKVKESAQKQADESGFDFGLEWLGDYTGWHVFELPQKQNRYGYETRCEVVSCSDLSKCQKGHGPCA